MRRTLVAIGLTLAALGAHADPALDERVDRLAQELRCMVCQNQSLADSQVPLAQDLKRHLRERLAAGRSEDEVVDELVARYGDAVRYRPALQWGTAALWFGPAVLLAIGLFMFLRLSRRGPAA